MLESDKYVVAGADLHLWVNKAQGEVFTLCSFPSSFRDHRDMQVTEGRAMGLLSPAGWHGASVARCCVVSQLPPGSGYHTWCHIPRGELAPDTRLAGSDLALL